MGSAKIIQQPTMIMHRRLTALTIALALTACASAQTFTENFGSLTNGTTITTSNTSLTYVRVGTGGGSVLALAPSNFSGSAAVITSPTSTSLNGIGVQNTLTASSMYDFSFDFRLSSTVGDFVIGLGSGTAFTQNGALNTAQGLVWLQSDDGNFERRTSSGSWSDVGGGTALSAATNYSVRVVANGSASSYSYVGGTLLAGTMDIYLNGSLIDTGVSVTTAGLVADGFRFYTVSGSGSAVEIDNISFTALTSVPEPSTYTAIAGALVLSGVVMRRRRRAVSIEG